MGHASPLHVAALALTLTSINACGASPRQQAVAVPLGITPLAVANTATFEPSVANSSSLVASDYLHHLITDALTALVVPATHRGAATVSGCFHLHLDGKISDAMIKESSGDADLDEAVLHALLVLTDSRELTSISVPSSLRSATEDWLCVRFKIAE